MFGSHYVQNGWRGYRLSYNRAPYGVSNGNVTDDVALKGQYGGPDIFGWKYLEEH